MVFSSGCGGGGADLEGVRVGFGVLAIPDSAVDQLAGTQQLFGDAGLGGRGGLLVDVDLVNLFGHGEVVRVVLDQAPALVLGQEPHAIGEVGEVHRAVVEELH